MNTTIISAYNQETGRLLGAAFTAVDAVHEPLRVIQILMEGISPGAMIGYWLVDFRGVPVARAQSPFGLVYLDESHHVLQAIEISPDSVFTPFRGVPASALVVLPGAITASRTKKDDQLVLSLVKKPTSKSDPASTQQPSLPGLKGSRVVSIGEARGLRGSGDLVHPVHSGSLLKRVVSSVPPPVATGVEAALEVLQNEEPAQTLVEEAKHTEQIRIGLATAPPGEVEAGVPDSSIETSPVAENAAPAVAGDDVVKGTKLPAEGSLVTETGLDTLSQSELALRVRPREKRLPGQLDEPWDVRLLYALFPKLDPAYRPEFDAPRADYWRDNKARPKKLALHVRLLSQLYPGLDLETVEQRQREQRRVPRVALPGLVGYFYTGGESRPQEIRNLSVAGFFMRTDEQWMPGTIIRVTLQQPSTHQDHPGIAITINCRVVSRCQDGVGFEFVLPGVFD